MCTPMVKNLVAGLHGNHPFLHIVNKFIVEDKNSLHSGVLMNDLAPIRLFYGLQGRSNWRRGKIHVFVFSMCITGWVGVIKTAQMWHK